MISSNQTSFIDFTMEKVAIFVEGMTEQEFIAMYLSEWFKNLGIQVQLAKQLHGIVVLQPISVTPNTFGAYVMIVDCANDEQVMTQIRDQYQSLISAGYTAVFGLRDVYPKTHAEIELLRKGLKSVLPSGPLKAEIHLAEMEIEAWFIAETTHFSRISPKLTKKRISDGGFDLSIPCESWPQPAKTLDQIYKLEGLAYRKRKKSVVRTISALSASEIQINVIPAVSSLSGFINSLSAAISQSP